MEEKMATNYQKGASIEYKIIEMLEKVGYRAERTAGSHGVFDVIAVNALGTRHIQSKRTERASNAYDAEIEQIKDAEIGRNATGELWVWFAAPSSKDSRWICQKVIKTA
jgi:Holliday junction resolvase